MTPEQLALLRQRITEGRQPAGTPRMRYAHPNGWNDALDFVERTMKEVLGEK
jgi:hypothetical protein